MVHGFGRHDLDPLRPEGAPGPSEADEPIELDRRPRPIDAQLCGIDLRRIHRLAVLRLRRSEPGRERVDEQLRTDRNQLGPQLGGSDPLPDRHDLPGEHTAGVEPVLDLHQAHSRLPVAGQQRPFDRCRTPPARQQREVEVDHRHLGEHVGSDQLTEGDDHAEVGAEPEYLVDLMVDGQTERERSRLHRARRERAAATAPLVAPGDDRSNARSPASTNACKGGTAASGVPR